MWLLNTETLCLREFSGVLPDSNWILRLGPVEIPLYAILSHCWGLEEVLFRDIQDLDRARGMAGFPKIENCCRQALIMGYKWIWIDTCCIDKSSSAELSEAINSMFKWYGRSGCCLVYMDDVDDSDPHLPESTFRKSRWFTRGWTLQELIAPKRLLFFSKSWSFLGTKGSMLELLSDITQIPRDALSHKSPFGSFSVAQRMSWAAKRKTTRIEDQAYSLMGLFGIFMPIIYGEGCSAFRRLQLEIIQHLNDQSIFAWSLTSFPLLLFPAWLRTNVDDSDSAFSHLPSNFETDYSSLLASSPANFLGSGKIVPFVPFPDSRMNRFPERSTTITEYSWTHVGLRIRIPLIPFRIPPSGQKCKQLPPTFVGVLSCWDPEREFVFCIVLFRHRVPNFYRCYDVRWMPTGPHHLVCILKDTCGELAVSRNIYITNQPDVGALDVAIRNDDSAFFDHWPHQVQLLIIFPNVALRRFEEKGFSLAGHAFQPEQGSSDTMEVHQNFGGNLLFKFQIPPCAPYGSYSDSRCPTAHVHLLFLNNATHEAFSIFVGYSRRSLVDLLHPGVSIDGAFHRPEKFSTLDVQTLCDGYNHHRYHKHKFRHPKQNDDPSPVRQCKCKCNQDGNVTTQRTFGNRQRGLSVTTSMWRDDREDEDSCIKCTAWVELSLFGDMYGVQTAARCDVGGRAEECSIQLVGGEAE